MKVRQGILLTVLLIAVCGLSACFESEAERQRREVIELYDKWKEQQAQDIPRYTADQVIYIASQYSPVCLHEKTTPSWEVRYISNGRWLVIKKCIFRTGAAMYIEQWDFYEDSGKLVKR